MANERDIKRLEKEILGKMISIKNGKMTPKESNIGKLFTILKKVDEVSYEKAIGDYKKILSNLK